MHTALGADQFLRSITASRDTLGRQQMKLLDLVEHVRTLTDDAPYAVVGGLAQILWARKTHTDDLDVALASSEVMRALERVRGGMEGWKLPDPPDKAYEADDVFEVAHLLYQGIVADLLAFRNEVFNQTIIGTAVSVPELGGLRVVRPELLLITHLLRPGASGALAAVELVIARRERGDLDEAIASEWARRVNKGERLTRVLEQARAFERL